MLRAVGLYHPLRDWKRDWRFARRMRPKLAEWRRSGRPPPPDAIKHDVIRTWALRFGCPVLVETGTFYGDAIFALRHCFREIHSIELAPGLHDLVRTDLAHLPHIHLYLGDSAAVLPAVADRIKPPTLYWLDGHFCAGPSARAGKDTPIAEELAWLLSRPVRGDVVLIDDARLFNGSDGYPTLDELRTHVAAHRPQAVFEVEADIVHIAPV